MTELTSDTLKQLVPNNSNIFVHGAAATPAALLDLLASHASNYSQLNLFHLHTEGPAKYCQNSAFRVTNLFVGPNIKHALDYDRVDYLPCFLSEIPRLFRRRIIPLDVALLQISPPDRFGYCSLGVSVDVAKAAAESAKILIGQMNRHMPRVHGDGLIHVDRFAAVLNKDESLPSRLQHTYTEEELTIARHVTELIEDGATLQMGIGAIPDAVAQNLVHHKNLGIHSEMWSDGTLSLIQSGAVTNSLKKIHPGKTVSSFIIGSQALYDFVDDNPSVLNLCTEYVNSPLNIARNPKVVAINSAVEIDLTGQVSADSVGHRIISGVGGQVDFIRGARHSEGGKSIIAMKSCTKSGESKIVAALRPGAGVVTTRNEVQFVVTEYGVANLEGLTIGARAKALIKIAHPSHQESLRREFLKYHS